MEWWQKAVVVPVKRAWIVVAARLTTRRKKDGKIIIAAAVYIYYPFIHSLVHPSKDPNNAFFLFVCVCVNVIISQSAYGHLLMHALIGLLIDFFCLANSQSLVLNNPSLT
jgi:hypothetical protein